MPKKFLPPFSCPFLLFHRSPAFPIFFDFFPMTFPYLINRICSSFPPLLSCQPPLSSLSLSMNFPSASSLTYLSFSSLPYSINPILNSLSFSFLSSSISPYITIPFFTLPSTPPPFTSTQSPSLGAREGNHHKSSRGPLHLSLSLGREETVITAKRVYVAMRQLADYKKINPHKENYEAAVKGR